MKKLRTKEDAPDVIQLRLYVAGQTPKSMAAISNLRKICKEFPDQQYHLEVIDLAQNPSLASDHQILAIPTLVRSLPAPICKIIGDLSDTARVVVGLNIVPFDKTNKGNKGKKSGSRVS